MEPLLQFHSGAKGLESSKWQKYKQYLKMDSALGNEAWKRVFRSGWLMTINFPSGYSDIKLSDNVSAYKAIMGVAGCKLRGEYF